MVGSIGIPVGLFWFAWCADKGVHWSVLCIATVPFAWGNLCLFVSLFLLASSIVRSIDIVVDIRGAIYDRCIRAIERGFGDGGERISEVYSGCSISVIRDPK
jgi:hypothetical protein